MSANYLIAGSTGPAHDQSRSMEDRGIRGGHHMLILNPEAPHFSEPHSSRWLVPMVGLALLLVGVGLWLVMAG